MNAGREYECFVRVVAVDAWDYSDLDASDVVVEDVREAVARS